MLLMKRDGSTIIHIRDTNWPLLGSDLQRALCGEEFADGYKMWPGSKRDLGCWRCKRKAGLVPEESPSSSSAL